MSSPATILVCDDEAAIRSIVAAKLRSAGYTVCEGRNGLEGYGWVNHSALPTGARLAVACCARKRKWVSPSRATSVSKPY